SNRTPAFDGPLPPQTVKPTGHARAAQSRLFKFVFHDATCDFWMPSHAKRSSGLPRSKQPAEKTPKISGPCRSAPARHENRTICMIQNAAREIAHDVMTQ